MKKIIRIEKENPKKEQFLINWMLHDRCTYQCSYCPPANKSGQDDWLKISFSKDFVNRLEEWLTANGKHKNVVVHFTGGEPTVWPKFIELVDHINSKGWAVEMTTNGSRSLAWWKENAQKFNHISMSYHSEHADAEEFIEKAQYLATELSYRRFFISIMMNPARWDQCADMVNRMLDGGIGIPFDIKPLQQNFGLTNLNILPYSPDQMEFMKIKNQILRDKIAKAKKSLWFKINHLINSKMRKRSVCVKITEDGVREKVRPIDLIFTNQVNFDGWTCNIGLEQIFINSLGNIHGGTCLQGPLIGNIQDPAGIVWPTTPVVCKSTHCGCYTDIKITKWKT